MLAPSPPAVVTPPMLPLPLAEIDLGRAVGVAEGAVATLPAKWALLRVPKRRLGLGGMVREGRG